MKRKEDSFDELTRAKSEKFPLVRLELVSGDGSLRKLEGESSESESESESETETETELEENEA